MFDADVIVILDTEYTSWEGCIDRGWDADRGEYRELVQWAAITVDTEEFAERDTFERMVSPQINPELSEYFRNLTGIEQSEVDGADRFEEVAREFQAWSGDRPVYSYGNDIGVLERNVELHDADVSFDTDRFHDVREVLRSGGVPTDEYTSGTVSEHFDAEPADGDAHDALYDCRSVARALAHL